MKKNNTPVKILCYAGSKATKWLAKNSTYLIFLFFLFLFSSVKLIAQTKQVTGIVKDDKGKAIEGASVLVKGSATGTPTGSDGSFTISVIDNAILVFTYAGMEPKEVSVKGKSRIDVLLSQQASAMSEVVIVAYGTQSKRAVTGAIQTVNAKELENLPVTQVTQQLQGKLAGVQITQSTGKPGQGMDVRIRGQASISAGYQPLYVIDGFPLDQSQGSDINNINPDDIESISVLKDAAAASLYGSRAAAGVVLITTKHAKAGQSSINVNSYYGTQKVPQKGRPSMMNGVEFAQFENDVFKAQNLPVPADYQNPSQYAGKGTDWYNILLRNAPIQNYSLSLSTSKDKFSSTVIGSFFNQDGVLLNSNFKRYSLRMNSEYKANDRLRFGFSAAPTYTINASPNSDGLLWYGGIIQSAILTSPLAPYKNADGTLPLNATGPGLFPNPNWYNVVQQASNVTNTTRLLASTFGELEIIKDLKFKSSIGIDLGSNLYKQFNPSSVGGIFNPPPTQTNATQNNYSNYQWTIENLLTYNKSFGKHNIDILAGYTSQRFKSNFNSIYAYNFPDDRIQTLNVAGNSIVNSDIQSWTLASVVGRINYNYNQKYFISGGIRRDGSSRFAPNTKYGNFPYVSAGWILSEENFMKNIPVVSFIKLRGSYGLGGNNNIGNYNYYAGMSASNYTLNGTLAPGKVIGNLGNNDLSWEKTSQLDLGLDLSLLKGRVSFTYDYYNKITSGLLFNAAIPRASGYSNILVNLGQFNYWGHEFSISSQNIVGALKWNTDFNISFNKNKVVKLGSTDAPIYGDYNITQVGQPIAQFYGYVFDGVYMNQADFDKSPHANGSQVGTVKMKDINGAAVGDGKPDGKIDANDQTAIGNPSPKFIFGITNTVSFMHFDFTVVAAGEYGNHVMNATQEYTQNLDGVFNVTKDVANRWKSEQDPGDGLHPRVVVSTPLARFHNSRWVSDASYLTIKNIALGYTIPLHNAKYIHSARVYGSIQQAFVFTKYNGANPEVNNYGGNPLNQGIDLTTFPVPRTFTFGVNIGL